MSERDLGGPTWLIEIGSKELCLLLFKPLLCDVTWINREKGEEKGKGGREVL